jgi:hypothetical protein
MKRTESTIASSRKNILTEKKAQSHQPHEKFRTQNFRLKIQSFASVPNATPTRSTRLLAQRIFAEEKVLALPPRDFLPALMSVPIFYGNVGSQRWTSSTELKNSWPQPKTDFKEVKMIPPNRNTIFKKQKMVLRYPKALSDDQKMSLPNRSAGFYNQKMNLPVGKTIFELQKMVQRYWNVNFQTRKMSFPNRNGLFDNQKITFHLGITGIKAQKTASPHRKGDFKGFFPSKTIDFNQRASDSPRPGYFSLNEPTELRFFGNDSTVQTQMTGSPF